MSQSYERLTPPVAVAVVPDTADSGRTVHRRKGAGDRVLDVGCGSGMAAAGRAARVAPNAIGIGVDRSAPMLALAGRDHRAGTGPVETRYVEADIETSDPLDVGGQLLFDAAYARF